MNFVWFINKISLKLNITHWSKHLGEFRIIYRGTPN